MTLKAYNRVEALALELCAETAAEQNVHVVDVTYRKEEGKNVLCFYIDKEGGRGIDECAVFSEAVETVLDEKDPIETEYSLEVSSPGVDRKLTREREFIYYTGREVDVKLYAAEDGVKEFSGILKGLDGDTAEIEVNDTIKQIPVKNAVYIKLHFSF